VTAPAVSVIVPVFDGAAFLDRAFASLAKQTLANWEAIAVDDGSTDASAEILAKWAAAEPRIRALRHSENRGQSAARNTALAAARGEWIAYLDCDDEFYPDHLARVRDWRDRGDVLVFRYDQTDELAGGAAAGRVVRYDPALRYGAMFAETIAVPLGVAHRRRLLEKSGSFDESLGRDEDGDLWRRFARAGADFTFVPHASGLYHVRSGSVARTRSPAPPPGLPSALRTVEIRDGAERYPVRIPSGESGTVAQLFERGEYGGVPLARLNSPPVIWDAGANVGTFALYAKLRYGRNAIVHCFEPYPSTVELLRGNLAPFPDVRVHPFGLGRRDGTPDLLVHARWAVSNSLRDDLVPEPAGRVPVRIRDAGAVWDELGLGEVDILKLDTEGAEVDILEGLGPRLARVRVVLAEFHTEADRRRIDAGLPGHELFGMAFHAVGLGIVKYIRADLSEV